MKTKTLKYIFIIILSILIIYIVLKNLVLKKKSTTDTKPTQPPTQPTTQPITQPITQPTTQSTEPKPKRELKPKREPKPTTQPATQPITKPKRKPYNKDQILKFDKYVLFTEPEDKDGKVNHTLKIKCVEETKFNYYKPDTFTECNCSKKSRKLRFQ